MIYMKWTRSELITLEMDALYTEVDEDGWVQREVGVASDGLVVHQLIPSGAAPGWVGCSHIPLARGKAGDGQSSDGKKHHTFLERL